MATPRAALERGYVGYSHQEGYLASASPAFDSWLCCLLAVQCGQIKVLSEPQTLST